MSQIEVDNHKLMYHPQRVSEWLEEGDCFPIYVEIGPTNRCNHRCSFCALDFLEHNREDIDKDILKNSVEDMANNGVKSIMFAGEGEPLLYKDMEEIVRHTKKQNIDVSITTNGSLFERDRAKKILPYLSWIRFSIDAGTKETYSKIRGVKESEFDKVLENISSASRIKKRDNLDVTIGAQFLLLSENYKELILAAEKIKMAGADNIQIKPYSRHPLSKNDYSVDYSKLKDLEGELRELDDQNFKVYFRKRTIQRIQKGVNYKECYGLPFFALIDAKGNVIPCNLFYNDSEFIYGNLYEQSFSEIWKSNRRKKILKKLKEKGIENCRKGCRLDAINRYLFRLKNPEKHDNFI